MVVAWKCRQNSHYSIILKNELIVCILDCQELYKKVQLEMYLNLKCWIKTHINCFLNMHVFHTLKNNLEIIYKNSLWHKNSIDLRQNPMLWGWGWGWCWAASFCSGIIRWIGNRNTTTVIRRDRCCRLSLHGLQKSVLIFNEKFTNTRRAHWPLFIRFFSLAELFYLSRRRQIWCNQAQTRISKDLF